MHISTLTVKFAFCLCLWLREEEEEEQRVVVMNVIPVAWTSVTEGEGGEIIGGRV